MNPTSNANRSSDQASRVECLEAIEKLNGELRELISEEVQSARADVMTAIELRDQAVRALTEEQENVKSRMVQWEEEKRQLEKDLESVRTAAAAEAEKAEVKASKQDAVLLEFRQALKVLETRIEEQTKLKGKQAVNSDQSKRTREFHKVHGSALRDSIYRIFNAARDDDVACFLELQDDNSVKVVALDESSAAQMVSPPMF
jgi:hypothetical protein